MRVEVCANSIVSALVAERAGADRIELCNELAVGGVTPSHGVLQQVCRRVRLPVHVLIRPRSGDFCYSREEFESMLEDIAHARSLGAAGIVSGCLRPGGSIDLEGTRALMAAAGDASFTFHRAFDRTPDPDQALDALESLGGMRILSSGQAAAAPEGLPVLKRLQARAKTCRFMPGGGIGPENVQAFLGKGFEAVHLSAIGGTPEAQRYHGPSMNSPALLSEGPPPVSRQTRIEALIDRIRQGSAGAV